VGPQPTRKCPCTAADTGRVEVGVAEVEWATRCAVASHKLPRARHAVTVAAVARAVESAALRRMVAPRKVLLRVPAATA